MNHEHYYLVKRRFSKNKYKKKYVRCLCGMSSSGESFRRVAQENGMTRAEMMLAIAAVVRNAR